MITQFKIFEARNENIILYKNVDFSIISTCDNLMYESAWVSMSAFVAMSVLIRENSKYLIDDDLRNVILLQKHIDEFANRLDDLLTDEIKYNIIKKYHSALINGFLDKFDRKFIDKIPDDVYINLTIKYYTLMSESIKKSKTLGDVIDYFKIIYNEIIPDLELKMELYKYNL